MNGVAIILGAMAIGLLVIIGGLVCTYFRFGAL